MTIQTLTIGKRRFVVVPERDFVRLQKRAGEREVRPEFAAEAMQELKAYRKTGTAVDWQSANWGSDMRYAIKLSVG